MTAAIDSIIEEVCRALLDEVWASQQDPGRAFEVTEGRWVWGGEDGHLYTFKADLVLPLPAETPVRLDVERSDPIAGILVAQHDFEVLVLVERNLGEKISEAKVYAEPWFIYDTMRKRLEDNPASLARNDCRIPMTLAGLENVEVAEDSSAAERTERLLVALGMKSLVPAGTQREALARSLGSPLHFVWGPPGTGKTVSLAQVVRGLVSGSERVLVLAHANAAVDVAMLRVADAFAGSQELAGGRVLRVGIPQLPEVRARKEIIPEAVLEREQADLVARKQVLEAQRRELVERLRQAKDAREHAVLGRKLKNVRNELAETNEVIRQALAGLVAEAQVVGTTLSRFAIDDAVWNWSADAVVIDEASMVPFPWALAAALRTRKRLLFFGDFRQLPPIHLARTERVERWLGRDIFEVMGIRVKIDANQAEPRVTMLDLQYRMAPEIADIVSIFAYDGNLRTAHGAAAAVEPLRQLRPWSGEPVILLDTSELEPACFREPKVGSYSRVNPLHAAATVAVAARASSDGKHEVALITPYRAQARLLAAMIRQEPEIPGLTAATVHRFQGSERDVVVLDLVDAPLEAGASRLTGSDAQTALRLLNVALSRARGKLIILAHAGFIRNNHSPRSPARRMLNLVGDRGRIVHIDVPELIQETGMNWFGEWEEVQVNLARDLKSTTGPVYINVPTGFETASILVSAIEQVLASGGPVTVFAPIEVAELLEQTRADLRLMNRPGGFFALVGGRIAWIGGHSRNGAFARLAGEQRTGAVLERLYLGSLLSVPRPDARAEAELARICGRCPECGDERRPRRAGTIWILGCGDPRHRAEPIDELVLEAIAQALGIRCPECGGAAVVRRKGERFFLGCTRYGSGCRGRLPGLEDFFGGE